MCYNGGNGEEAHSVRGRFFDGNNPQVDTLASSPEPASPAGFARLDMEALGFDEVNWENVGSTEWPVWVGEGGQ